MLYVATMGLMNSPGFFQHRIEDLLADYLWQFVLVYVDDIIIFSRSPEEHIKQLEKILGLLFQAGITLNLSKYYFKYPLVKALGHYVSRLGMST